RMVREASAVPAKTLTATGHRLAGILGTADEVHVTAPSGTDLTFSVRGRQPMIYDGIVDDEDIAAGVFESSIPSGSVTLLPQNPSVRGEVAVGVGGNQFVGGPNKSAFGFESTVRAATVEADGKPIVRDGKLLVA